jgi:hypothetical protein
MRPGCYVVLPTKKALHKGVFAFPLQAEFCGETNMACATFYKKGKAL